MRINSRHGFFIIDEAGPGEASHFMSVYGLNLVTRDNYMTFEKLLEAPSFSIKGTPYLDAIANVDFEGLPWEVMRANGLIYNFNTGLVASIESVTQLATVTQAGKFYSSNGLLLPGSLTNEAKRVTDYVAWVSITSKVFRYSEVAFE